PEDVYLRPSSRFVAGFLGAVNWIAGVGVRPEATRIASTGSGGRPAIVTGSVFLGNCVQGHARLASGEVAMGQVPRECAGFSAGDSVELHWNPADEMRFP